MGVPTPAVQRRTLAVGDAELPGGLSSESDLLIFVRGVSGDRPLNETMYLCSMARS